MPARPRTAAKAAAKVAVKPSTWARLKAQALADQPEFEPYPLDAVDPPILIPAPETVEQQVALMEMFTSEGQFRIADARRILHVVCGDRFDAVWAVVRGEKMPVLLALIEDISRHFEDQGALEDVDEEDVPGGSVASST